MESAPNRSLCLTLTVLLASGCSAIRFEPEPQPAPDTAPAPAVSLAGSWAGVWEIEGQRIEVVAKNDVGGRSLPARSC